MIRCFEVLEPEVHVCAQALHALQKKPEILPVLKLLIIIQSLTITLCPSERPLNIEEKTMAHLWFNFEKLTYRSSG